MSGRWNNHWLPGGRRGLCNQYRNFDGQAFKILLKLVSAGWERQWLTGANNYLLRTSKSHCSNNMKNPKLNSLNLTNLHRGFMFLSRTQPWAWPVSGALTNKDREMTEILFLVSELAVAHPGNNQPGCFDFQNVTMKDIFYLVLLFY